MPINWKQSLKRKYLSFILANLFTIFEDYYITNKSTWLFCIDPVNR